MKLTPDDRIAITDLISLHGHLVDGGSLDELDLVFTDDVTYDVTDLGSDPIQDLDALRKAAAALGDKNPVGHHVTNVVLTAVGGNEVNARSKGIGINADGSAGSVTYDDVVTRGPCGWRISYRRILARRKPLGAN